MFEFSENKGFDGALAMAIATSVLSVCRTRSQTMYPLDIKFEELCGIVAGVVNARPELETEQVRQGIEFGIQQYRSMLIEPGSIDLGAGIDLELRPAGDGDRLTIGREGHGYMTIDYLGERVAVDVHPEDSIDPVASIVLDAADLRPQLEMRR